eukprot:11163189-Lingulodinium_polyedra.AAC.1
MRNGKRCRAAASASKSKGRSQKHWPRRGNTRRGANRPPLPDQPRLRLQGARRPPKPLGGRPANAV